MALPTLPRRVHYALKILCCLVGEPAPVRAREVARCTEIPAAQVAKTLYLLTWGGFVQSRRGSKGGFWLRRPAEQIGIHNVIQFLLPPLEDGRRLQKDPVLRVWQQTAVPPHQAFQRMNLADLVRKGNAAQTLKCVPSPEGFWRFFA